jgi:hypothetical protein
MTFQRGRNARRPAPSRADELPLIEAEQTAPKVRRTKDGRVRDSASAAALAKLPRKSRFTARQIKVDPRFHIHERRRVDWLRRRRQELYELCGYVSHSVGAMLSAASWLYAAADFAAERAAETAKNLLAKSSTITPSSSGRGVRSSLGALSFDARVHDDEASEETQRWTSATR